MSLSGRTVVITRAKDQSASLATALRGRGAVVVEVAVLVIAPPGDRGVALRAAAASAPTFDWIVLTSPNGVDAFVDALAGLACATPIAVVGSGTAARLATFGLTPALVPQRFVAEGLVEVFPPAPARGGRVLVAQAEAARDVVARGLRAKGWDVLAVAAYRSVAADVGADAMGRARSADAIVFTSSSTVERFVAVVGARGVAPVVACIGPVTAATARAMGLEVSVVAEPHTIAGLVDGLDTFFADGHPRDHDETS